MKKITLAAFAILFALSSCKKEDAAEPETVDNVTYIITCTDCKVTMDIAAGKRVEQVKGQGIFTDVNQLTEINVVTEGTGDSVVNIKLDGIIVYFGLKSMDVNNRVVHTAKIAR
jgi:hypothetical protein